jgi:hypothetical protein
MDASWTKSASEIAQTLGFAGAAVFFLYKAVSGYLRVNLAMKVNCERQPSSDGMDFLAIQVHLKKGQNGTLVMHDLSARVTYGDHKEEVQFDGVRRLARKLEPISRTGRAFIDWSMNDDTSPLLKLVPEEEIDLTALHKVPSDAVCLVQVCLVGQALSRPVFGQYKCSTASFPRKGEQA